MHGRTRRALVTSLLVACGAAVTPHAGAAALPAASCTVRPSPDGTSVTISGEGFSAPRNLNDGETTERLNVDANGTFLLKRFQKNAHYTVLAVNEDQDFVFVNCKVVNPNTPTPVPSPHRFGSRQDRVQGLQDGAQAGLAAAADSCSAPPVADKSGAQRSDAYWQSWTRAADRVFHRACGG
ncbi:hypothetical protein ACIRBY_28715 [Streptomyces sp. NPDC096136]|uniref:hypothetical protein n=1 Tax=Streptomyces sp. NPDC096136 TaxID=3366076 RepID=UPI003803D19B